MIVEQDAELQPLPDDEQVPDASRDTAGAAKRAGPSVRSRLPLPALAGLAGLIGVAAIAGTTWTVRRRGVLRRRSD